MDADRAAATAAIVLLVLSAAVVWDVSGERTRMATEAEQSDAAAAQVASRQAVGDFDADGIADSRDVCPTRPETDNGFQDDDGCPDLVATTGAS